MVSETTYLITGANRGIGLALTAHLLLRPNTTIIATTRSPATSTAALLSLRKTPSTTLIITHLSHSLPPHTPELLLTNLTQTHKITHIDILILNAGTSSFTPLLSCTPSEILSTFETNTLLPITLFQTLYPLLTASTTVPKVIYMSSFLGSIAAMEESPSLAYGMSKAAANYFVRKVHFECNGVVALAVHPGWLKTENGQIFAEAVGVKEAPMEVDGVIGKIVEQIDNASRETTSGSFVKWDGEVVPW